MNRPAGRNRIYFVKPIGLDGPIKIGCSAVPEHRILDIALWAPWPLELIGSVEGTHADETFMHQCFFDHHSHGEWFRISPSLKNAIAQVLEAKGVSILRGVIFPKGNIRKGCRSYTPARIHRRSYAVQVRQASRKLRDLDENGAWHEPDDVAAIFLREDRDKPLSAAQIARIEAYLAAPAAQSVIPSWRQEIGVNAGGRV